MGFVFSSASFASACRCGASSGGPGAPDPTATSTPTIDIGPRGLTVQPRPVGPRLLPHIPRGMRIDYGDAEPPTTTP
jgi:hypothetical protein